MDWVKTIEIVGTFLIGGAGIYIGWSANQVALSNYKLAEEQAREGKRKLTKDDKEMLIENYNKVSKALEIVFREGDVTNEAFSLIWQARNQAKLFLPKKIEDFTQELQQLFIEANHKLQALKNIPISEERSQVVDEKCVLVTKILRYKPHEIYSEYLKLNIEEKED